MQGNRAIPAILLSASMLLAACNSTSNDSAQPASDSGPVAGGGLVDLQNFAAGDPDHIDPALAVDTQSSQIAELLYDGLTESSTDGQVRNAVAESVTSSSDAKTWTFRLRNDVKFDNNDPVRASDFKFAWERVADPELASKVSYHLASIQGLGDVASGAVTTLSGVVADDEARTLTVTLDSPRQDFSALVSIPVFSPLPKRVLDAQGQTQGTIYTRWEEGVMVGNGPFRMAKPWERGRAISLARSDSYYGGVNNAKAFVDTLEFRVSKGVDSAFTDFEGGAGHVARIPTGRFADLKNKSGDDVVNPPLLGTEYWAFNMRSPTLGGPDNLKLRKAIATAINRPDIIQKVYSGSRQLATSFVPPAMPGYQAFDLPVDRNVEQARQLLREWGKTPPSFKISFNAGAGHEDKASILQQNLAEIGITATPDPLENTAYRRAVGEGAVELFWQSWNADYVSYDNFIGPVFSTASIGRDNVTNYSNPSLDALVNTARAEPSADTRNRLYRDAEKTVLDDQVVIPLSWRTAGLVKQPAVRDLQMKPLGYVDYASAWLRR